MPKLTQSQLEFFNKSGYLIVERVLDELDLAPVR